MKFHFVASGFIIFQTIVWIGSFNSFLKAKLIFIDEETLYFNVGEMQIEL